MYTSMLTDRGVLFLVLLGLAAAGLPSSVLAQDRSQPRLETQAPRGTVQGTVVEAATGAPIASATAALWNATDSSLVTGAITQDDGTFAIEGIRPGRYTLRVSFVGFQTQTFSDLAVTPQTPQIDLGRIALEEDTALLDEVEVTAEREAVEVGIDRTTYNVEHQPMTAGGSGIDVLEQIPSIEVDIDDTISLRGSENVAIHLNGKPAPMRGEALVGFLRGLSAESIKRVEVIPNPSARYEPDGMSGIINIVLAQDGGERLGGSVSANADTNERYGLSGNGFYGNGPWNVFANYGLRYGQRAFDGTQFRENRYLDPTTFLEQERLGERGGLSHTLNASADYRLSEQDVLSFSGLVSQRGSENENENRYVELDDARNPVDRYTRRTDGTGDDLNMDYRLAFKRTIAPSEHELAAEVRYEQEWEDDHSRYTEEQLVDGGTTTGNLIEEQAVDERERSREASAQIDYVRPLTDALQMEAGYKGSFERLDSRFYSETRTAPAAPFAPDVHLNNTFVYDEHLHAAYAILGADLGAFGVQAGLRFERAFTTFDLTTTGETFDNDYASFYPSAHLTYEPAEGRTVKLSYSKRVRRPSTWQLNPFGDYDDPTSRRVGNPYLTPQYTHAFEVGYSQFGGRYTVALSPYYRRTVDAITWSQRLTDDGVTLTTFENFATQDSYGAELIGTLRLGQRLRATGSFNAYQRVTDGSNVDTQLSTRAFGYSTRASASVSLPSGVELQLSQFYRAPMDVPGGRIDAFTRTDLALQKKLMDDRARLGLRVSDVFDTMGFNMRRESPEYYQTSSRSFNAQGLQLSFRYNFGQQNDRRDRTPRRGDDEYEGGEEGMMMQ